MRFLIHVDNVDTNWQVTITCSAKDQAWRQVRTMRKLPGKLPDGRTGNFPMPPLEELPTSTALPCALWANDMDLLCEVYRKIVERRPDPGDMERFGCYLFEVLIGDPAWKAIQQAAEETNAESIELALCWPASEKDLYRLNWEMMHSGDGFLVAGSGKAPVSITRLIAVTTRPPRQVPLPPRVLFVIGTSLTDPQIRPGAEYLGLLRHLKRQGLSIYSRVLENATPLRMKEVMERFRPHVVHFICHGNIDRASNRGYLELATDEQEVDKRRFGDQLVEYLRVDGDYPPIVVLSACSSAAAPDGTETISMMGAYQTAPLVAELVQGGVPVVVGMAGRISDLACRLFTRQFGEALIQGESLVRATAEARRATFAEGAPPQRSVDWAFPAVFLAENVDPDYAPVKSGEENPAEQIEQWIRDYDVERVPVFCGRDVFFQAYYDFFTPGGKLVLAASVEEMGSGFGKTRLLQELTIQALRDGHVPCLVSAEQTDWEPPRTAMKLGEKILDAIHSARQVFGLEPPLDSQLLVLKKEQFDDPKLDSNIKFILSTKGYVTVDAVRLALQKDLIKLAKDVRQNVPIIQQAKGHVLVLLDDVEKYDQALVDLFNQILGPSGLGTAEEPVPVVLAFSLGPAFEILRPILESSKPWLKQLSLKAFSSENKEGEDMLAYVWVLLHPFKPTLVPGISDVPLVVNDEAQSQVANTFRDLVRNLLKGIPGKFAEGNMLYGISKTALENGYLRKADDDDFLRKIRERIR